MAQISRATFFDGIVSILRKRLSGDLAQFRTRRFGHLLKVHYDNERIHYEVWVDTRRQQIELGLHLEEGPASTIAYLQVLDDHIVEIKEALGPQCELARWTQSWGHLIETRPLGSLDADERAAIAERLVLYIESLQPILDETALKLTQQG